MGCTVKFSFEEKQRSKASQRPSLRYRNTLFTTASAEGNQTQTEQQRSPSYSWFPFLHSNFIPSNQIRKSNKRLTRKLRGYKKKAWTTPLRVGELKVNFLWSDLSLKKGFKMYIFSSRLHFQHLLLLEFNGFTWYGSLKRRRLHVKLIIIIFIVIITIMPRRFGCCWISRNLCKTSKHPKS